MSPEGQRRVHPLRILRERHGERVRFDRFMSAALYDPGFGYYARQVRGIGRSGDFSTSATLSPLLARALASWLRGQARAGFRRDVIEVGAGSGALAEAIFRELGWGHRLGLHYRIVEVSGVLREAQQQRLGRSRVEWHTDLREALTAARGAAWIFSNELVDAFPCRLFRRTAASAWVEGFVCLTVSPPQIEWLPVAELPPSAVFEEAFPAGQIVEVQESYREWLEGWVPSWKRGRMLTIDYGDEAPTLYHRRPAGTLRGYFFHERVEGATLLERIGRQDLTVDVNFTDLRRWGESLGLRTLGSGTQAGLLRPFVTPGPPRPEEAFLTDPEAAGGAFRFLEQVPDARPGG